MPVSPGTVSGWANSLGTMFTAYTVLDYHVEPAQAAVAALSQMPAQAAPQLAFVDSKITQASASLLGDVSVEAVDAKSPQQLASDSEKLRLLWTVEGRLPEQERRALSDAIAVHDSRLTPAERAKIEDRWKDVKQEISRNLLVLFQTQVDPWLAPAPVPAPQPEQ